MAKEDYFNQVDSVRLLITDIGAEDETLFSDDQVMSFLELYAGDVRRASARALRTIAASEVLLGKKITTQDLSTDAPAVSAELRALADSLDAEADAVVLREQGAYADYVAPGFGAHCEGEEWRY